MKFDEKFCFRFYFVVIFITILLSIYTVYRFNEVSQENNEVKSISLDFVTYKLNSQAKLHIDTNQQPNTSIGFLSSNENVYVYYKNKIIYSLELDKKSRVGSTGYIWNFVNIDKEYLGKDLKILLKQNYDKPLKPVETYIGDKGDICNMIFYKDILKIICFCLFVIFGTVMMIYALFIDIKKEIGFTMFFLGLMSIFIGIWRFSVTSFCHLILPWCQVGLFIEHCCLMFIPITFCLYIKSIFNKKFQKWIEFYCVFSLIIIATRILLQTFSIMDMGQTLVLTHIDIIVLFFLFIILTIKNIIYEKSNGNIIPSEIKIQFVGIITVLCVTLANLILYRVTGFNSDTGAWTFFIYIIIVALYELKKSQNIIGVEKQFDLYKKLAYKDEMTNTYNWTAYLKDTRERTQLNMITGQISCEPTTIFMLDLNNLKYCNDNYGHSFGDKYIKIVADVINDVFEYNGKCYRVGGDEFSVIMPCDHKITNEKVKSIVFDIQKRVKEKGLEILHTEVDVAIGYSVYNSNIDTDLFDTKDRADNSMYENKIELKNNKQKG